MPSVVFLRAVNVGKANRCRPAEIAKKLAKFDVVNIGAVGTFVVRKEVKESTLRDAIARQLPFKIEIMICSRRDLDKLISEDPFARQPSGSNITWFVSVLAKRVPEPPRLPFYLPSDQNWGVKITAIQDRFVVGLYIREMKAVSYLGKLEKLLAVPMTTRSWTTMQKVAKVLADT